MKKIAILHFAYPPNIGGVESMIKEHAEVLTNLDYEVTVVTGSGEETNPRIKLAIIPELQSVVSFNPFLQEKILSKGIIDEEFYKLAEQINNQLEKTLEKIDIVVVHNMITIVRNLPFVYAFKNFVKQFPKKKYIGWIHDHSYINEFQIKDLDKIINSKLEKELLTIPIKNVTYVLISESFREPFSRLMGLNNGETVVIPNGIDIKHFLEIDDLIWEIIEKYKLLKGFPLILSPVNILERKNLDYCIETVSFLKKTYPQIKYIITGKPSKHRSTMEYFNLLKKKVEVLGLKDNVIFFSDFLNRALMKTEIHDLYQIADLVFFLSKSENFGLPLLESSLTKTPIFVSDLKVFREVGGDFVKYLDYKKLTPEKAGTEVMTFLKNSRRVQMNYRSRSQFELKTILTEKFIPLIEK
ncbi:glycosyltransferase family 4 protein [Candidatus Roizmanbacteria bacterium]|nr:glycosyltransferase family 4 protein [Candidatus Roizmanbacteria bacterium]